MTPESIRLNPRLSEILGRKKTNIAGVVISRPKPQHWQEMMHQSSWDV